MNEDSLFFILNSFDKMRISLSIILLFSIMFCAFAQNDQIQGKVIDTHGQSIPGITVSIPNTGTGTITNIDGEYQISVPQGTKELQFSFIGMKNVIEVINGRKTINVTMEDEMTDLDEVVVTAYGAKGKVGLKGAITTIDSKSLDQIPSATFDQALQGKATGLQIISGSGQPGSGTTKIRIRGNSSINGNADPLYIVDGIPVEANVFAQMNTNDIETINVLKDASASSIYGSRASNGVILITTKRGQKGATKVTYRYQNGWSFNIDDKYDMMNSSEKLAFEELARKGQGWALSPKNPNNLGLSEEQKAANVAQLNKLRGINYNWDDVFLRTGKTYSHEINLQGGNEKTTFYFALQTYKEEGQVKRSSLDRTVGRLNLDHQINEKLKLSIATNVGYSENEIIDSEGSLSLTNPIGAIFLANPYEVPYDENGNVITRDNYIGGNALDKMNQSLIEGHQTKGIAVGSLQYDITKYITFKTQYGIDYRLAKYDGWIAPDSYAGKNVIKGNQGELNRSYRNRTEATFTNTVDYKKQFAEKHDLGVILGSEYNKRNYESFGFTGYGLDPLLRNSVVGVTPGTDSNNMIPDVKGSENERALYSLFAIANYIYNNKYVLSTSIRRDGSSAFSDKNKHAILYSAGLTWYMKNEEFLQDKEWIQNLKMRVSYGTTGNQSGIDDYEHLTTWVPGQYGSTQTIQLANSGNEEVKWEIGHKFNMGWDYRLFNNKLHGVVDVYNEITSDLFILQSLSATAGIGGNSRYINAGKMRNRGIELMINSDVIQNNDFQLTVGANISYNDNEILDLGNADEFILGTGIIREGLPIGSHYVVEWAGVDPLTGDPLYYTKDGKVTRTYNEGDAVANFGTSESPLTGGANLEVRYKNFSLNTNFVFANDFARFNNQVYFQENPNFAQWNQDRIMLTAWQKPGDITEIQRLDTERQVTSKDIDDASYLRWKGLVLSYQFNEDLLKRTKLFSNVRIYAQAMNLYTWTKYRGADPEDSNNIATYEYPAARKVTFGIDITF